MLSEVDELDHLAEEDLVEWLRYFLVGASSAHGVRHCNKSHIGWAKSFFDKILLDQGCKEGQLWQCMDVYGKDAYKDMYGRRSHSYVF